MAFKNSIYFVFDGSFTGMLLRINSLQKRTAVDNLGERKLHNNALHVLIAIQLLEL